MNMPMANNWMTQLNDPNQWKSWFDMVPQAQAQANPIADILKEAGATIKPEVFEQLRTEYVRRMGELWQDFMAGKAPQVADRRFADPAWRDSPMAAYNVAVYLLNGEFMSALAEAVETTPHTKQQIRFAVLQVVDAMSPANFLATNPEAQKSLIETKGESLTKGMTNMLADLQKGRISQSDESAFEVGRNVATMPGSVVYENALFQLIQYAPTTPNVHQRPLLMVPPCINKFYILDLQPENSVVRYVVDQGNTVFLISWRNPDQSMAKTTWDDYIEGVIQAVEVTRDISGQDKLNMFGFCVGGTIVTTALAVLKARGENPAASLTLLTSLLDFSDTGVLDVFIDEAQVRLREQTLGNGGLLPGRDLASTFSALRPNDLVWNYVQANYLKGKQPPAFDLLYWNADSTGLPGPMFCWYLRNTYLENNLKVPGKLTVAGVPLDLSSIDTPTFIFASREDHIVPWQSAYASMSILNPKKPNANRFILGASGHIAGVINPMAKKKRSYWSYDKARPAKAKVLGADEWLGGSTEHPGSWWGEWAGFLAEHGGPDVKPPAKPGNKRYAPTEAAPGRYVRVRAE